MTTGELIREKRNAKKLTLENIANAVGLTGSAISQIERGIISPSVVVLGGIAKMLDCGLWEIIGKEDQERIAIEIERLIAILPIIDQTIEEDNEVLFQRYVIAQLKKHSKVHTALHWLMGEELFWEIVNAFSEVLDGYCDSLLNNGEEQTTTNLNAMLYGSHEKLDRLFKKVIIEAKGLNIVQHSHKQ